MNRSRLLFILPCILLVGCGPAPEKSEPEPTPNPATHVARTEANFQTLAPDLDDVSRSEARQTARDFVKTKLPNWSVKGTSAQMYDNKIFWVDVDIENKGASIVVSFYVEKFFPETGNPYNVAQVYEVGQPYLL